MTARGGYEYPAEVRFEIAEQDLPSYLRAADFLNITDVDVVCVEHEFGIFGGPAGSHVLALLRELRMPIVTTLHTVLREPNAEQRRVMRELIRISTRLVVMAERGRELLREVYRAPAAKVDLIPHGIPDMPFADPNYFKDEFGVAGKQVLLTFGLLSPNKGIEFALRALPDIIREFPNVVYIVLGQTHPNLLRDEGEAYRLSLERLAKDLGVQKNVVFFNRFVELEELMRFIGAADIYLTPYLTESQITSGTLAYAFGAGNAVVSTPYWHAAELLTAERGKLVPFRDAAAIASAVVALLRDEPLRHTMRKNAYRLGRDMIWSRVAQLYLKSFDQARRDHSFVGRKSSPIKTLDEQPGQLPEMKLDHLFRMSDSTGIFQHASFSVPNFAEGYCTDDNARALVLATMLQRLGIGSRQLSERAATYAAFLNHAFDRGRGRFRNFMSFDRRWLEEVGSEDCQGHALWALGLCVGQAGQGSFQMLAAQLFEQALPVAAGFTSPRAWAFTLIGIDEYLRRLSGDRRARQIRESLTAKLMQRYADAATEEWQVVRRDGFLHERQASACVDPQRALHERRHDAGDGPQVVALADESPDFECRLFSPHRLERVLYARQGSRVVRPATHRGAGHGVLPASRPITPPATWFGWSKRAGPLSGSWGETIWAWPFTIQALAAVATVCTWTA